eukprot:Gb_38973 [translate_table: standard]
MKSASGKGLGSSTNLRKSMQRDKSEPPGKEKADGSKKKTDLGFQSANPSKADSVVLLTSVRSHSLQQRDWTEADHKELVTAVSCAEQHLSDGDASSLTPSMVPNSQYRDSQLGKGSSP